MITIVASPLFILFPSSVCSGCHRVCCHFFFDLLSSFLPSFSPPLSFFLSLLRHHHSIIPLSAILLLIALSPRPFSDLFLLPFHICHSIFHLFQRSIHCARLPQRAAQASPKHADYFSPYLFPTIDFLFVSIVSVPLSFILQAMIGDKSFTKPPWQKADYFQQATPIKWTHNGLHTNGTGLVKMVERPISTHHRSSDERGPSVVRSRCQLLYDAMFAISVRLP